MLPDEPAQTQCMPDEASIEALVHGFYADVRTDPLLGPVFEKTLSGRWDAHLARMVDFWSTVALGCKSYRGNVLATHKQLQGITPAHFATWFRLWSVHTERLFTPDVAYELQYVAHGIGRNLFRGLFGRWPDFEEQRAQADASEHSGAAVPSAAFAGHDTVVSGASGSVSQEAI